MHNIKNDRKLVPITKFFIQFSAVFTKKLFFYFPQ